MIVGRAVTGLDVDGGQRRIRMATRAATRDDQPERMASGNSAGLVVHRDAAFLLASRYCHVTILDTGLTLSAYRMASSPAGRCSAGSALARS